MIVYGKEREKEMRFKFMRSSLIVSASLVFLLAVSASAQEFQYKVQQDRSIGHRDGELTISAEGVEWRATKREKESRSWSYTDLKLVEILSPTKIRIWTYKDRALRLGRDQSLTFKLIEGQIDQKVSDFLRGRIGRPFVTSFTAEQSELLAEVPVKHARRFSGSEGLLKVYADRLVYESKTGNDSRSWRWTDIRGVGRPDRYRFDIDTFQPELGVTSKSYNFELKEEMADKVYDLIWSRVYQPTPLIRVERAGQ